MAVGLILKLPWLHDTHTWRIPECHRCPALVCWGVLWFGKSGEPTITFLFCGVSSNLGLFFFFVFCVEWNIGYFLQVDFLCFREGLDMFLVHLWILRLIMVYQWNCLTVTLKFHWRGMSWGSPFAGAICAGSTSATKLLEHCCPSLCLQSLGKPSGNWNNFSCFTFEIRHNYIHEVEINTTHSKSVFLKLYLSYSW